MSLDREYDCIVCGEVCVDLSIRSIDRHVPLDRFVMLPVGPIVPGSGGIVSNSGMALAKMGLQAAALGCVGDDVWADILESRFRSVGLATSQLIRVYGQHTSATAILIGDDGEHTFAFHAGASRKFDRSAVLDRLDLFGRSRFALFGYYGLMPQLESDLPEVLAAVRETGCRVALDSAGGGGDLQPLDQILPHLDMYIPSFHEARSQTGETDPRAMIQTFRQFTPHTLLGVKLGSHGALLSPNEDTWIEVSPIQPPSAVMDTTGAGDCFYAGLIAGLSRGRGLEESARIAAAAGACSVTGVGAVECMRTFDELLAMAERRA